MQGHPDPSLVQILADLRFLDPEGRQKVREGFSTLTPSKPGEMVPLQEVKKPRGGLDFFQVFCIYCL